MDVIQVINYFLIYAFLGWTIEVIYHAVGQGTIVNRGFLNGPICPIYGFGMLLILYLLMPISDNLGILFVGGMLLTTGIELLGGFVLEKLFSMRWWDYSKEPFNLHGYICVKFSIAWGLCVVGAVRMIHPLVANVNDIITRTFLKWLLIPAFVLLLVDMIATVKSVLHLKKQLKALDVLSAEIRELSDKLTQSIGGKALETEQKLEGQRVQAALGRAELKQQLTEQKKELEKDIAERRRKAQVIRERLHAHKLFGAGRIIAAHLPWRIKESEE